MPETIPNADIPRGTIVQDEEDLFMVVRATRTTLEAVDVVTLDAFRWTHHGDGWRVEWHRCCGEPYDGDWITQAISLYPLPVRVEGGPTIEWYRD